jgi:hypothetical protein
MYPFTSDNIANKEKTSKIQDLKKVENLRGLFNTYE